MKTLQEQAIELLYKVFNQLDADNEILPNSDLYEEIGRWLSTNDANIKPTVSGGAVKDWKQAIEESDLSDRQTLTHQQKAEEWGRIEQWILDRESGYRQYLRLNPSESAVYNALISELETIRITVLPSPPKELNTTDK